MSDNIQDRIDRVKKMAPIKGSTIAYDMLAIIAELEEQIEFSQFWHRTALASQAELTKAQAKIKELQVYKDELIKAKPHLLKLKQIIEAM